MPFMLYPITHWRDVAKAVREKLAAHKAARDHELKVYQGESEHHARLRKQIIDNHDRIIRNTAIGYQRHVQLHLDFISKFPHLKDNRPAFSDPPGSPHKDRISPRYSQSPYHHKYIRRLKKSEGIQRHYKLRISLTLVTWELRMTFLL